MKHITLSLSLLLLSNMIFAQKYLTKEGEIDIFSKSSLFTIEAKNSKVASVLNAETGDIVVSTLVRSFKFHEALVEEHFNENYMESHKYPKAVFKGKIKDFNKIDITKNGEFEVIVEGSLTVHGQTKPSSSKAKLIIENDHILAETELNISLEEFKIIVEESYKDRIQDKIKLNVKFDYTKMNQS